MEVSGQLHTPACFTPRERATNTQWIGGCTRWRREKIPSLTLPEIKPRSSSPYHSHYTESLFILLKHHDVKSTGSRGKAPRILNLGTERNWTTRSTVQLPNRMALHELSRLVFERYLVRTSVGLPASLTDKVSGELRAPAALPPGKELLVPTGWEAGWAPKPVWMRWWREISLASAGTGIP
jgi:hypothetical protein